MNDSTELQEELDQAVPASPRKLRVPDRGRQAGSQKPDWILLNQQADGEAVFRPFASMRRTTANSTPSRTASRAKVNKTQSCAMKRAMSSTALPAGSP